MKVMLIWNINGLPTLILRQISQNIVALMTSIWLFVDSFLHFKVF